MPPFKSKAMDKLEKQVRAIDRKCRSGNYHPVGLASARKEQNMLAGFMMCTL